MVDAVTAVAIVVLLGAWACGRAYWRWRARTRRPTADGPADVFDLDDRR